MEPSARADQQAIPSILSDAGGWFKELGRALIGQETEVDESGLGGHDPAENPAAPVPRVGIQTPSQEIPIGVLYRFVSLAAGWRERLLVLHDGVLRLYKIRGERAVDVSALLDALRDRGELFPIGAAVGLLERDAARKGARGRARRDAAAPARAGGSSSSRGPRRTASKSAERGADAAAAAAVDAAPAASVAGSRSASAPASGASDPSASTSGGSEAAPARGAAALPALPAPARQYNLSHARARASAGDGRKFYVKAGDETLTLRAESPDDRDVWVFSIRTARDEWTRLESQKRAAAGARGGRPDGEAPRAERARAGPAGAPGSADAAGGAPAAAPAAPEVSAAPAHAAAAALPAVAVAVPAASPFSAAAAGSAGPDAAAPGSAAAAGGSSAPAGRSASVEDGSLLASPRRRSSVLADSSRVAALARMAERADDELCARLADAGLAPEMVSRVEARLAERREVALRLASRAGGLMTRLREAEDDKRALETALVVEAGEGTSPGESPTADDAKAAAAGLASQASTESAAAAAAAAGAGAGLRSRGSLRRSSASSAARSGREAAADGSTTPTRGGRGSARVSSRRRAQSKEPSMSLAGTEDDLGLGAIGGDSDSSSGSASSSSSTASGSLSGEATLLADLLSDGSDEFYDAETICPSETFSSEDVLEAIRKDARSRRSHSRSVDWSLDAPWDADAAREALGAPRTNHSAGSFSRAKSRHGKTPSTLAPRPAQPAGAADAGLAAALGAATAGSIVGARAVAKAGAEGTGEEAAGPPAAGAAGVPAPAGEAPAAEERAEEKRAEGKSAEGKSAEEKSAEEKRTEAGAAASPSPAAEAGAAAPAAASIAAAATPAAASAVAPVAPAASAAPAAASSSPRSSSAGAKSSVSPSSPSTAAASSAATPSALEAVGPAPPPWLLSARPRPPPRVRLPPPAESERSVSLWSIIKGMVGKDLSRVCLPVYFNEPLSALQKAAEEIEYSALFDEAALWPPRSAGRLLLVSAAAISAYASTWGRTSKPFNPLLGETYELLDPARGVRIIAEKVVHHPTIIALHAEGAAWRYDACSNLVSKFWGRSIEVRPEGVNRVTFADGDAYSWNKVVSSINNLVLGKIYVDHAGVMVVRNIDPGKIRYGVAGLAGEGGTPEPDVLCESVAASAAGPSMLGAAAAAGPAGSPPPGRGPSHAGRASHSRHRSSHRASPSVSAEPSFLSRSHPPSSRLTAKIRFKSAGTFVDRDPRRVSGSIEVGGVKLDVPDVRGHWDAQVVADAPAPLALDLARSREALELWKIARGLPGASVAAREEAAQRAAQAEAQARRGRGSTGSLASGSRHGGRHGGGGAAADGPVAAVELWRKAAPPPDPTRYNLTAFAIRLNEMSPEDAERAAPTDCRRRPDQAALEAGRYALADAEKQRLEVKQRAARAAADRGDPIRPRWFHELERDEPDVPQFYYAGGYWEAREKGVYEGCRNIFGK